MKPTKNFTYKLTVKKVIRGKNLTPSDMSKKSKGESHHSTHSPIRLLDQYIFTLFRYISLNVYMCMCVCMSDHMPFSTAARSPQASLNLASHKSSGSHCVIWVSACAHTHVHAIFRSWGGFIFHVMTNTYKQRQTKTHTQAIATQTAVVMAAEEVTVGSCMCGDWSAGPWCPDSLPSTFSQPSHLCCSAVTLATMTTACEPARLPRTQRWLSQPLTSEAATKRRETSRFGSSVNRLETKIFSTQLK